MDALSLDGASGFQLRFASLFVPGRALSFACDENGSVDLERLSNSAKHNYLFARGMVGRDYSPPCVCVTGAVP